VRNNVSCIIYYIFIKKKWRVTWLRPMYPRCQFLTTTRSKSCLSALVAETKSYISAKRRNVPLIRPNLNIARNALMKMTSMTTR
jgi:hypothetical protein